MNNERNELEQLIDLTNKFLASLQNKNMLGQAYETNDRLIFGGIVEKGKKLARILVPSEKQFVESLQNLPLGDIGYSPIYVIRYISECLSTLDKIKTESEAMSFQQEEKLETNNESILTEVETKILDIFRHFNIGAEEQLQIQSIMGAVEHFNRPHQKETCRSLETLVQKGYLKQKPNNLSMYFLTQKGADYIYPTKESNTVLNSNEWDTLKDGDLRIFCFLKIDAVGHSEISRENPQSAVEETFDNFFHFVEKSILHFDGKIWKWEGDGGLCAYLNNDFTLMSEGGVQSAITILEGLNEFNKIKKRTTQEIQIRAAVHVGQARYKINTGIIHSDAINFVCHLEANKDKTLPNSISISEDIYKELSGNLKDVFQENGDFEGKKIYTNKKETIENYSKEETKVLGYLIMKQNEKNYMEYVSQEELQRNFPDMSAKDLGDVIESLQSDGLVESEGGVGSGSYGFHWVQATPLVFVQYGRFFLDFNPEGDIEKILSMIVSSEREVTGEEMHEILNIEPVRINSGVGYLAHKGFIEMHEAVGTAPYIFDFATPTPKGKKAIRGNKNLEI